jgi:hypothetical protein
MNRRYRFFMWLARVFRFNPGLRRLFLWFADQEPH